MFRVSKWYARRFEARTTRMSEPCAACGKSHRILTADQCRDRSMPEATLQARVTDRAKRRGWVVARVGRGQVGAAGFWVTPMMKGWADGTLLKAGHRIIFVEFKRELGTLEAEQLDFLKLVNLCGAHGIVIRPSDLRTGVVNTLLDEGSPL